MFALAAAAALAAQAAPAAPAQAASPTAAPAAAPAMSPAALEITALEQQWGQAFVTRDFAFLERIVAPEYKLVGVAPDGTMDVTPRAEWMANARAFTHHAFTVETLDVNLAGDTAAASARGVWTVTMRPNQPARALHFFVTDTWVRRGGQWQVIHRVSQRLGEAPVSPPALPSPPPPGNERG